MDEGRSACEDVPVSAEDSGSGAAGSKTAIQSEAPKGQLESSCDPPFPQKRGLESQAPQPMATKSGASLFHKSCTPPGSGRARKKVQGPRRPQSSCTRSPARARKRPRQVDPVSSRLSGQPRSSKGGGEDFSSLSPGDIAPCAICATAPLPALIPKSRAPLAIVATSKDQRTHQEYPSLKGKTNPLAKRSTKAPTKLVFCPERERLAACIEMIFERRSRRKKTP